MYSYILVEDCEMTNMKYDSVHYRLLFCTICNVMVYIIEYISCILEFL